MYRAARCTLCVYFMKIPFFVLFLSTLEYLYRYKLYGGVVLYFVQSAFWYTGTGTLYSYRNDYRIFFFVKMRRCIPCTRYRYRSQVLLVQVPLQVPGRLSIIGWHQRAGTVRYRYCGTCTGTIGTPWELIVLFVGYYNKKYIPVHCIPYMVWGRI
jgi:hypothetical protein